MNGTAAAQEGAIGKFSELYPHLPKLPRRMQLSAEVMALYITVVFGMAYDIPPSQAIESLREHLGFVRDYLIGDDSRKTAAIAHLYESLGIDPPGEIREG